MARVKLGGAVVAITVLGILGIPQLLATEMSFEDPHDMPIRVSVDRADQTSIEDVVYAFGEVLPRGIIEVAMPQHGAAVSQILVTEGEWVARGQLLAQFDKADTERELKRAKFALNSAQADVTIAQSLLEVATAEVAQLRAELARLEQLANNGTHSVVQLQDTTRAVERSIMKREAEVGRLARARAAMQLAQIEVEHVEDLLESTAIYAPVEGRITTIAAEIGVAPAVGDAIFKMTAGDQLQASLDVLPDFYSQVGKGDEVRLWTSSGQRVEGTVLSIAPPNDVRRDLARVRVGFPSGHGLTAGVSVRAELITATRSAIIVPISALFPLEGGVGIYRVIDGRTVATEVESVVRSDGKTAEIISGLPARAVYVSVASSMLRDSEQLVAFESPNASGIEQTAALIFRSNDR